MSTAIQVVANTADYAEVIGALERDGAVVIENFLDDAALARFNTEVDSLLADRGDQQQGFPNDDIAAFFGDAVTHLSGLAGKSPAFCEYVLCHPAYMAVCDHLLLPNCADYQLNVAHLMQRGPGCEAQFIHRDAWVWKRLPPMTGEVQVASLVALSEFTADNGGTLLVPGSHRWEGDRYPQENEIIAAEMPAGAALIYLGNTFHGGGANVTPDNLRRGLHVSYALGWLRTEENQCLATPPEVAATLPRRAQELLGFGLHDDIAAGGGYLGTVELEAPAQRLVS